MYIIATSTMEDTTFQVCSQLALPYGLDHILVSEHFVKQSPNRIGYVQFLQYYNDHLTDDTLKDEERDMTASDHAQVVAHFVVYARD